MSKYISLILLIVGGYLLLSSKSLILALLLVVGGLWLLQRSRHGGQKRRNRSLPDDWPERRRAVWERDKQQCRVCRQPLKLSNCDIHHITPRSKGGNNELENLLLVCKPCHAKMPDHQHLLRRRQYRS
jgi:5-methylcytosine-specific restriction endonuclease McrA